MRFDFDRIVDRADSNSTKWDRYGPGVLPMWIADMDFEAPPPVVDELARRLRHGVFGYEHPPVELHETVCARMQRLYNWQISPEDVVFLPGVVTGLNVASRAFAEPGEGVLVQTPVYPPFLAAPGNNGLVLRTAPLQVTSKAGRLTYGIDWDAFEDAITPTTRLFTLCHPHNPTGATYAPSDLLRMASVCDEHGVIICSDEIHCDLLLGGARHTPMAALSEDIAARTVTLMAPSKTFNIPGLGCSFAIIQESGLRERFLRASLGIVPHVNGMGLAATLAAYRDGDEWLRELRAYLTANRDYLLDFVQARIPGVAVTRPDATYLAWLDCREAGIPGNAQAFFLREAGVAFNDGAAFGAEGEGFVRLNFGTQRARLREGLDRMHTALLRLGAGAAR